MYLYENARSGAANRLRALEQIEDVTTIAALLRLPPLQGLSCLEAGAGAGSIAAWLAERVGAAGQVLATDIDVAHLDASAYAVRRHDLARDELPGEAFDLVHVRHVLIHLPAPAAALRRIRAAMRPGAHLLVEESDLGTWAALGDPGSQCSLRLQRAVEIIRRIYSSRGMNVRLGAGLARALREEGFSVVDERASSRVVTGGSPEATYQKMSTLHLADAIAAGQPELSHELAQLAHCFDDPALQYRTRTTVSVTARRTA
jgi:SAM-dependent methyltransferase